MHLVRFKDLLLNLVYLINLDLSSNLKVKMVKWEFELRD